MKIRRLSADIVGTPDTRANCQCHCRLVW